MDKVEKDTRIIDGNGETRKLTPELKQKFEDSAHFLDGYGYNLIAKNEENDKQNTKNIAAYNFKNSFTIQLGLSGIWIVCSVVCLYQGMVNIAYLFMGCVFLMLLSIYFSFKCYYNS